MYHQNKVFDSLMKNDSLVSPKLLYGPPPTEKKRLDSLMKELDSLKLELESISY